MAATPTQLKESIAPEFATKDDSVVQVFLDRAALYLSESVFGTLYDTAVLYLAAHMMTITFRGSGDAGKIVKKKVGDIEVQYSNNSAKGAAETLSETSYGREFMRIRRTKVIGVTAQGYTSGRSTI